MLPWFKKMTARYETKLYVILKKNDLTFIYIVCIWSKFISQHCCQRQGAGGGQAAPPTNKFGDRDSQYYTGSI